ncbi:glutathione S-transferase [Fusarium beomiforme]|uniref:Glutathione S-transferase n=1 Tax=Fusarium beomiforme TaxID=44412 RepID=A0A9P5APG7_9HYPO|nr:glutathione S-transferase [Fusarium beomiforme]
MSLKLYYSKYSTSDLTVAVLTELEHGLPEPLAERIQLDLAKGESKTPEYLKNVNPNGLVPAIVHNGVSIWESVAVTMYLGETFGVKRSIDGKEAPMLYPSPGTSRGEAMKWLVWANTYLIAKGKGLRDAQASKSQDQLEKALSEVNEKVRILDSALQGRDYILGDWYSLVDTHLWATIAWLAYMGLDVASFPTLASWKEKVEQRPAIQRLQQE